MRLSENMAITATSSSWKQEFMEKMLEMKNNSAENHLTILTREDYDNLLKDLQTAKTAQKKTTLQYRRLKRFDIAVAEPSGVKKLIKKTTTDSIRYYLPIDEIFDVLDAAHAVGHAGRDRLKSETAKTYANITTEMIKVFLSMCLCNTCHSKRTKKTNKLTSGLASPLPQFNNQCQVDLIDLTSQPDRNYKFILVYQDDFTQFVVLKALKTRNSDEVTRNLIEIFCCLGAPCLLYTDNGREINGGATVTELEEMWPGLKVIRGGSECLTQLERASRDIKSMLAVWMQEKSSSEWSQGLGFVQFGMNQRLLPGTGQSPYKALFGMEPRFGLVGSYLC